MINGLVVRRFSTISRISIWMINKNTLSAICKSYNSINWVEISTLLYHAYCRPQVSVKKVILQISRNSQENTCVRVSFWIKLQACKFCEIFKNPFFIEPRWLLLLSSTPTRVEIYTLTQIKVSHFMDIYFQPWLKQFCWYHWLLKNKNSNSSAFKNWMVMHLSNYLANIYLLRVNNRNFRRRCEICSKLIIKTIEL